MIENIFLYLCVYLKLLYLCLRYCFVIYVDAWFLYITSSVPKRCMFWKKNLFQKDTFFTFSMYDFMKNCKFQKKLMVFIEFLLTKNYEKLLFTKNNVYLMSFLNTCEKFRIYIF